MTTRISFSRTAVVVAGFLLAAATIVTSANDAEAQFENKAMNIGSLHHMYNEVGGETEYWWSSYGLEWPSQYQHRGTLRANHMWIARTNFTDGNGQDWPFKIAHVGQRATGFGEYFPQEFRTVSRFPHPEVSVDGLPSIRKVADVDEVDPDMKYDRKIVNVVNSVTGITIKREVFAFSHEDHDNYHIQRYTLTNTGNTDGDADIEAGDQAAEGVYLHLGYRYGYCGTCHIPGQEWGANVMNDIVGDGVRQYETDLRARYTFMGNSPGADIDPLGSPIINDQHWFAQEGDDARLVQQQIMGTATVHAPAEPGGPDADNLNSTSPDELQPSVTGWINTDHSLHGNNSHTAVGKMRREYDMLSGGWAEAEHGHMDPHHANWADPDDDFTTVTDQGDVKKGTGGGYSDFYSYGPYTIPAGESVTIVQVQGVDGLNRQEAIQVGQGFKTAINETGDRFTQQKFSIPQRPDVSLSKNAWVLTGIDSLFSTFDKAIAGWESSSAPPRAPLPPESFAVNSGVGSIELQWTPMDGGPTRSAWEVYRSTREWEGDATNNYEYEKIATLEPSATSYTDEDVQRGLSYFYYIQAVGTEEANDGSVMTNGSGKLRSNRSYTQTYTPASLKRPPGDELSDASVVPNPYVISADESVAWPDENRLAFLDIPGQATIRIYTEMGELVKTIEHTDGSGDDFWQLETEDRQIVTTGVYVAVITNNETGRQTVRKFSVIR